jgi:hypothetical protein
MLLVCISPAELGGTSHGFVTGLRCVCNLTLKSLGLPVPARVRDELVARQQRDLVALGGDGPAAAALAEVVGVGEVEHRDRARLLGAEAGFALDDEMSPIEPPEMLRQEHGHST